MGDGRMDYAKTDVSTQYNEKDLHTLPDSSKTLNSATQYSELDFQMVTAGVCSTTLKSNPIISFASFSPILASPGAADMDTSYRPSKHSLLEDSNGVEETKVVSPR